MKEQGGRIVVVGVGPAGLDPAGRELLASCPVVLAPARLKGLLAHMAVEVLPLSPLQEALARMEALLARGDIGVLVGGDPLFFGIGRTLIARFGRERCRFQPAVSMVQAICARCGAPWDDAAFVSVHGRPLARAVVQLLLNRKSVVFTDGQHTPAAVARAMLDRLTACGAEDLAGDFFLQVGESLGSQEERLVSGGLEEIAAQRFAPLTIMLVQGGGRRRPAVFGLEEDGLEHSRGLITKEEVRAVCLHKLRLPSKGVLWDVGAGSGSVGLEACLLRPELLGFAVERRPEALAHIRANIARYGVCNLLPVPGEAPAALAALPVPDRIFIGGSGGRLAGIIAACCRGLPPRGRIVVTAVTAATGQRAPDLLARHGLAVNRSKIAVERLSDGRRLNPITVIVGQKAG